jgi:P-type E1-E2 ATPase
MITYEIPGRGNIGIQNIIFDYNGTIAVDGKLIEGVKDLINQLSKSVNIYILTADTYGSVISECGEINGKVLTFPNENAGKSKREIVKKLGGDCTLSVGNGYNDIPMFNEAALSIAVIEGEGASGKLLVQADIVTRSILETLEILLNGNMVKATLRN